MKVDNRGKSVQRINGCRDDAWTMDNKKKKKEKKRRRERGREEEEEEERTAREAIGRSKGKFIYTEAYIPTRNEKRCRWTIWWWLGVWTRGLNWFTDFPPSGTIYKSAPASSS